MPVANNSREDGRVKPGHDGGCGMTGVATVTRLDIRRLV
jgi:hypothetical protein